MRILIAVAIFLVCLSLAAAEDKKGQKIPRLKFKKGPVCMCSSGLSEKDISGKAGKGDAAKESGSGEVVNKTETLRHTEKEE